MLIAASTAIRRIPDDELAELWFGFRQQTLSKLQVAARDSGMQDKEIGVRLGKDPATISRCLRGKQNMTMRTMHDLARGMNCRLRVELDRLDEVSPVNRAHGLPWRIDGGHLDRSATSALNNTFKISAAAH